MLAQRDVTHSGVLADRTAYRDGIDGHFGRVNEASISTVATLTLTVVPAPGAAAALAVAGGPASRRRRRS